MTTVSMPCLRCNETFDTTSRTRSRYCPPCRKVRKLESNNAARRQIEDDRSMLRAIAESMREYLDPSMYVKVEDYVSSLGVTMSSDVPLMADRMPDGSDSPAGPDDGMSTTDSDLANQLDVRRMDIIMHDWFADNPHWTVGMHG